MKNKVYWCWLQSRLGISASIKSDEIVSYFGTAKNIYSAGEYEWRIAGIFNKAQLNKLDDKDLTAAEKTVDECVRNGWRLITPDDEDYPPTLLKLPNFPLVLYVDGDLGCLKSKLSVAVVGSRHPSRNSACIARALSASLTRSGAVVVSGGAMGIDSAAHTGVLDENGATVSVLGCGFNAKYAYPSAELKKAMSGKGAVITEYPPNTQPVGYNFPCRNRIISGLSYGTIIIEAGLKSGSLITANYTIEQGRDVFAVPGDVLSDSFSGSNKLIRDGAKPVFSAMDVLEEYGFRYPELIDIDKVESTLKMRNYPDPPSIAKFNDNPKKEEKGSVEVLKFTAPPLLSDNAKKIYETFDRETMQADELILKTELDAGSFASAMTELELLGYIELLAGKNYKIIQENL